MNIRCSFSTACNMFLLFLLHTTLQTCQQAVKLQPGSSMALCALGEAQLGQFDLAAEGDKTATDLLKLAQLSFRASIEMEGKPVSTKGMSLGYDWNSLLASTQHHSPQLEVLEA